MHLPGLAPDGQTVPAGTCVRGWVPFIGTLPLRCRNTQLPVPALREQDGVLRPLRLEVLAFAQRELDLVQHAPEPDIPDEHHQHPVIGHGPGRGERQHLPGNAPLTGVERVRPHQQAPACAKRVALQDVLPWSCHRGLRPPTGPAGVPSIVRRGTPERLLRNLSTFSSLTWTYVEEEGTSALPRDPVGIAVRHPAMPRLDESSSRPCCNGTGVRITSSSPGCTDLAGGADLDGVGRELGHLCVVFAFLVSRSPTGAGACCVRRFPRNHRRQIRAPGEQGPPTRWHQGSVRPEREDVDGAGVGGETGCEALRTELDRRSGRPS